MALLEVSLVPSAAGLVAREKVTNAPAFETENARFEQLGPFRQDNPAASQGNTLQTLVGVDAVAPTGFHAGRAGTIVGICAQSNAAITAGTATFRPAVNGVVAGAAATESAVLSSTAGFTLKTITNFANPISFAAGDLLGVMLATNAGYLPVTADHNSYLLVRWAA